MLGTFSCWRSHITEWEPPLRFVDEQTRGPVRKWHHKHLVEPIGGGKPGRDMVDYSVYGGKLINQLVARPGLRKIFAFQSVRLRKLFPSLALAVRRFSAPHRYR